jgi:hypothetical protein
VVDETTRDAAATQADVRRKLWQPSTITPTLSASVPAPPLSVVGSDNRLGAVPDPSWATPTALDATARWRIGAGYLHGGVVRGVTSPSDVWMPAPLIHGAVAAGSCMPRRVAVQLPAPVQRAYAVAPPSLSSWHHVSPPSRVGDRLADVAAHDAAMLDGHDDSHAQLRRVAAARAQWRVEPDRVVVVESPSPARGRASIAAAGATAPPSLGQHAADGATSASGSTSRRRCVCGVGVAVAAVAASRSAVAV